MMGQDVAEQWQARYLRYGVFGPAFCLYCVGVLLVLMHHLARRSL